MGPILLIRMLTFTSVGPGKQIKFFFTNVWSAGG